MPTDFPSESRFKPHPAGLLLGGALLGACLISPATWTSLPDICLFHRATGLLCPTCGMTRSWAALARGEFALAMRFHALGAVALAVLVFLVVFRQVAGRWPQVPLAVTSSAALLWVGHGVGRMLGVWAGF